MKQTHKALLITEANVIIYGIDEDLEAQYKYRLYLYW